MKSLLCLAIALLVCECSLAQSRPVNPTRKAPAKEITVPLDQLESDVAAVLDERWRYVFSDDVLKYYYDSESLSLVPGGMVKTWVRQTLLRDDELGRSSYIVDRIKGKRKIAGFENFAFSLDLFECDCQARQYRILGSLSYDTIGGVIESKKSDSAEWWPVVPNTNGETILQAICKAAKTKTL